MTLDGARALAGERAQPAPFLHRPLPPPQDPVVELDDLVRFVSHPARAFLRQRLGVSAGDYSDELEDVLPVELDGLQRWAIGGRLLTAVLAGAAFDDAVKVEVARGELPPGLLARPVIDRLRPDVEQIAAQVGAVSGEGFEPGSVDVNLALADGRRLSGTVAGVCGDVVRAVSFSAVKPAARLAAWVRLLALTAAHPQRPFQALTIGRVRPGAKGAKVTVARIAPLAGDATQREALAKAQLAIVADLHARGMREPLPLACLSSAAYARAATVDKDPVQAARKQWESAFRFDGEDAQREHVLVFGEAAFDELLARRPRDDESGEGWDEGDDTRFGRLARRLWSGLLDVEQVSDR